MARWMAGLIVVLALVGGSLPARAAQFSQPWLDRDVAIILDPYELNVYRLEDVRRDRRVIGIIHRASIGLKADARYRERRLEARRAGLKWGSYHLLTTDDVAAQVDGYLAATEGMADEVHAIDVECLAGGGRCANPRFAVSIDQVKAALKLFRQRTGRLPLVYANGSVTAVLGSRLGDEPELAGVKLWYARFKPRLTNFPEGVWPTYTLWQFSSEINCAPPPGACPYRVPGTKPDMDLNVYNGSTEQARRMWPFD